MPVTRVIYAVRVVGDRSVTHSVRFGGGVMSVLDEIVAGVREDVAVRQAATPLADVQAAARDARPALDALAALRAPGVGVIAEVKRRSPSKAPLPETTTPAALAAEYSAGGARVISVLTEGRRFG